MNYFITALTSGPVDREWKSRTFGYFSDKQRAIKAVENNEGDLQECLYEWIVIEKLGEGIHCFNDSYDMGNRDNIWFKWNNKKRKWILVKKPPEEFAIVCNFAVG